MRSSLYLTPLPLYGSGLLYARIFAATSPINCLSIPDNLICVGLGISTVIPFGIWYSTG